MRCQWPTGTVYSGPQTCGRPAKAIATSTPYGTGTVRVCGIHAATARRRHYPVTSLTRPTEA
jgi:hypothetical protein